LAGARACVCACVCAPSQLYKELLKRPTINPDWHVYLGCCCFFLGMYAEADAAAQKGPQTPLQNRLLFHLSHKV
jgi:intraflagellar transport protein 56